MNIIRNWVGQNTEEDVLRSGRRIRIDGLERLLGLHAELQRGAAEDPALFLENARDTILRFRNHPSIVIWCGRNEGVPQPVLNEGLINCNQHARRDALLLAQLEPGEPAK